ncbi:MAG: thioesterase [Alphaproteobacteria bacterium]|nr:thioesterase [Alphaproteobacteria bacterium]
MTNRLYQERIRIRNSECNVHGMSVLALFQTIQYMAEAGTNAAGIGLPYCRANNLTWMARRHHVEINRLPQGEEMTTWSTWNSALGAASVTRDIEVTTEDGERLIGAASEWLLVNVADPVRPRLSRLTDRVKAAPVCLQRAVSAGFPDIAWTCDASGVQTAALSVGYTDCDFHRQVNNATYAHWALRGLDPQFLMDFGVRTIDVDYKNPSRMGEKLVVQTHGPAAEQPARITRHRVVGRDDPGCVKALMSVRFGERALTA